MPSGVTSMSIACSSSGFGARPTPNVGDCAAHGSPAGLRDERARKTRAQRPRRKDEHREATYARLPLVIFPSDATFQVWMPLL